MAKKRRRFSREFKIEVIREIEQGTKQAEVCRKHNLHPVLVNLWRREYRQCPDTAFQGHGRQYKDEAKIAELEQLVGKLYIENEFLKKTLTQLEKHNTKDEDQEIEKCDTE
jgi:transposase